MPSLARIIPAALVCVAGLAATPAPAARPQSAPARAQPSDSPAARCAREFVAMVNDPTPANVRAFETAWASTTRLRTASIDDRVPRVAALHQQWGDVTVTEVSTTRDNSAVLAAKSSAGVWLELRLNMSASEAGKLDSIEIEESSQPIERRPLTPEVRAQTVQGVADTLRSTYVYPDKGAAMADAILSKLRSGDYDSIASEPALAKRLTDDCRAITNDRHLGVRAAPRREGAPPTEPIMGPRDQMRRENYAFRKVEILDANVGYLRFDAFMDAPEAKRVATNAMNFLSGCDALIFDMRYNGGGSPEMVQYITSYLFDSRTHLNDMVDRDGKVVEEYWTLTDVPGPRPRAGIPVYVLASSRTFSGAEEFCNNLKSLGRATIVGETTGGGAHPVQDERVNDRFLVRVPYMRAQNPITKSNWEGTGVEPDVKTTAAEALDKAAELARAAVASKK